jgi:1-acyl-sn-glycerol-3-phosphate acyltransferase
MIAAAVIAGGCRLIAGPAVEWRCDPSSDVQRIYFGNHASHLDFIIIWSALPWGRRRLVRPVAGREYWERNAIRRHLARRVFNAVLVDREHAASPCFGHAATERMAHEMGDRHSLIVFPEGTRSLNGEIAPFKSGLYHLSRLRPGVELIPVHLENLNRILPKGESLPVPMLSRVVFGPPLHAGGHEEKRHFLANARAAVIQLGARP